MKYITFRCDRCGVIRKHDHILKTGDEEICTECLQSLTAYMEVQTK